MPAYFSDDFFAAYATTSRGRVCCRNWAGPTSNATDSWRSSAPAARSTSPRSIRHESGPLLLLPEELQSHRVHHSASNATSSPPCTTWSHYSGPPVGDAGPNPSHIPPHHTGGNLFRPCSLARSSSPLSITPSRTAGHRLLENYGQTPQDAASFMKSCRVAKGGSM